MKIIELPFKVREPILARGADMKGSFAFAKRGKAYLFDGFGDLSDLDNFTRYEKAIEEAGKRLKIRPRLVVCDLHPGYFSTHFAKGYSILKVQHHEAHIASAIADNKIKTDVLGAAFDGTGYGPDGNIWGGEFFTGDLKGLKRIAHLDYIPMPGAEMCVKEPWRMAASYLYSVFGRGFLKLNIDFVKDINKKKWAVLKSMIDKKINSPLTSSMGRFFDAAAAIILNKKEAFFEAELPIDLERTAGRGVDDSYDSDGNADILIGVVADIEKRRPVSIISARFHNSIAELILKMAKKAKRKKVVLSGGVFQNKYLREKTSAILNKNNFEAYVHLNVQTNDSGIPLGQLAIAGTRALCV